jgi:hypothetical protein
MNESAAEEKENNSTRRSNSSREELKKEKCILWCWRMIDSKPSRPSPKKSIIN